MSRAKLGAFDFAALSERCVKCGKCIQVCTIHGINGDEVTSPRGFVDLLMRNGKRALAITYHDPCHARKMQGIWKEPRGLLAQNYEITEMDELNKCCGFGGVTMQTERYELAREAGLAKARAMADLPVRVVSAECSACRMQLNNSLSLSGSQMRCVNPLELIAEALMDEENYNG